MKVAIVAPSRALPREAQEKALTIAARTFGDAVKLQFADQCFFESGHFAGDDHERAQAFVRAANDPEVDAVWFARGGYGSGRILDRVLPRLDEPARTKTYVGYSDTGYLLAALSARGIGQCVHGPMVSDVLREGGEDAILRVLRWFLEEDPASIEPSLRGRQQAVAFNLAILASLVATEYLPDLKGRTLMIEDVGEHLYAIDRALFTAFASGRLAGLAGLRLGRVSDVPENDIEFGETPEEIVRRWCAGSGTPFLGAADIGHDARNKLVPFS